MSLAVQQELVSAKRDADAALALACASSRAPHHPAHPGPAPHELRLVWALRKLRGAVAESASLQPPPLK